MNWNKKFLERSLGIHLKNCKHAHTLFQYKTSGNLSQGNNPEERKCYEHKFIIHHLAYLKIRSCKIRQPLRYG